MLTSQHQGCMTLATNHGFDPTVTRCAVGLDEICHGFYYELCSPDTLAIDG